MKKFGAPVIFTGETTIENSVVLTDEIGKIIALDDLSNHDKTTVQWFDGAICPGFVNAHCHIELSVLKGLIETGGGLINFIEKLTQMRRRFQPEEITVAIENADRQMQAEGIVAVADISNTEASFYLKQSSPVYYHTFIEQFGVNPETAASQFRAAVELQKTAASKKLPATVTPHAAYSVAPALIKKIFEHPNPAQGIYSIHNQESADEEAFFKMKKNRFRKFYEEYFGMDEALIFYSPATDSLNYLLQFAEPEKKIMLVHNTYTDGNQMKIANTKYKNLFWCTCPKANLYIENRLPDYRGWMEYSNKICVGTDSLASNDTLSVIEELKIMQSKGGISDTELLIKSSTINGARFLNIQHRFGSIEPGKTPGINLLTNLNNGISFSEKTRAVKII